MHAAAALRRRRSSASRCRSEQAALARKRVAEAGLTDRVEIRVQDYRDVDDGPFDAISSIGMAEHVGRGRSCPTTSPTLHALLRPGGRLLNHAISWDAGATTWDDRHASSPATSSPTASCSASATWSTR